MEKKKNGLTSRSLQDALQERLNEASVASREEAPPDYLIHRRIRLKALHTPTGKTKHYEGKLSNEGLERDAELQTPHQLIIAQIPPDRGYYLLYLDDAGNEITDTYHDSMEGALAQAEWEFRVRADEWDT